MVSEVGKDRKMRDGNIRELNEGQGKGTRGLTLACRRAGLKNSRRVPMSSSGFCDPIQTQTSAEKKLAFFGRLTTANRLRVFLLLKYHGRFAGGIPWRGLHPLRPQASQTHQQHATLRISPLQSYIAYAKPEPVAPLRKPEYKSHGC